MSRTPRLRALAATTALVGLLATGAPAGAQNVSEPETRGDSLMRAFDTPAAIEAYRRGLDADPDHPTLLRKAALALSQRAEELAEEEGGGPLHEEATRLARSAVEVDPGDARAHAILAVALGRQADWTARERRLAAAATVVNLGSQARHHAARALELDPDDWVAHAFLGVMHRRLATVPPIARRAAQAFLRWPDVSLQRGAAHLVKAVREEPNEVTTRIELARAFLAMGREADARRQLEVALAIEPRNRLDELEQERWGSRLRAGLD